MICEPCKERVRTQQLSAGELHQISILLVSSDMVIVSWGLGGLGVGCVGVWVFIQRAHFPNLVGESAWMIQP